MAGVAEGNLQYHDAKAGCPLPSSVSSRGQVNQPSCRQEKELAGSALPRVTAKSPAGCCEIQIRRPDLKEGLCALDTDRPELVRVKTEQLQDCWGDLRRLYGRRDGRAASRSAPFHQDRDVPVLEVITAVLGDLGLVAGVDNPVLGDSDHVGYSGIAHIDAHELRRSGARVYLQKTGRRDGLAVDTGRRIVVIQEELARKVSGGVGPVAEPEEDAIVIDPQGYQRGARMGNLPRSVESGDNLAVVDPVKGRRVHRRLA